MGNIKAIRSEADYNAALARIEALMDAEPDTHEGDELDVLADLVEHYEGKHVPMGFQTRSRPSSFVWSRRGSRREIPFRSSAPEPKCRKCSREKVCRNRCRPTSLLGPRARFISSE